MEEKLLQEKEARDKEIEEQKKKLNEEKLVREQKLKALDAEFEKMLVMFNVLPPKHKRIRDTEARKTAALTDFDASLKPEFTTKASNLMEQFKAARVFDEDDRSGLSKKLLDAIKGY